MAKVAATAPPGGWGRFHTATPVRSSTGIGESLGGPEAGRGAEAAMAADRQGAGSAKGDSPQRRARQAGDGGAGLRAGAVRDCWGQPRARRRRPRPAGPEEAEKFLSCRKGIRHGRSQGVG
ncbi:hypothetical protein NCCP1664_00750 [Zafaria cholistanensis]|uniref:Uncharacterized protein n=1 Tax=Zafaria cholistanensis TaxID=1682741 RepID=A0A5A7NP91_9MICC|nr:hypothetical protein NCCP1664_00750 [Zafaria cholistanensis]